jgi:hypothetical protein
LPDEVPGRHKTISIFIVKVEKTPNYMTESLHARL